MSGATQVVLLSQGSGILNLNMKNTGSPSYHSGEPVAPGGNSTLLKRPLAYARGSLSGQWPDKDG